MATRGLPGLAELFDEAPTPHIAHPPHTHHRDVYVATDGADHGREGGLGVVVETRDGRRLTRVARPDAVPDNNVAEYRALHLGLDVLAAHAPAGASVGVLVDHDDLAANVNAAALALRGAGADGAGENPAHPLANAPEQYAHVNREPSRCVRPRPGPPAAGSDGDTAGPTLPPSRYADD